MEIKASDEWKEHALDRKEQSLEREKGPSGESPELMVPAERPTGDPDALFGAESANLKPGGGVTGSGQGGNAASGPRDDLPSPA